MDRKCKTYTVGMMRYIDMLEHKQKVHSDHQRTMAGHEKRPDRTTGIGRF